MPIQLVMPQLGESVVEGTISKWLVREGDVVGREQPLVEVGTDKADSELPAPSSGRVSRILVKEGEVVKVGQVLCELESVQASVSEAAQLPPEQPGAAAPAPIATPGHRNGVDHVAEPPPAIVAGHGRPSASPLVRKLALERGIDVSLIEGTGGRGRVTREDILQAETLPISLHEASRARNAAPPSAVAPTPLGEPTPPPSSDQGGLPESGGVAVAPDPELVALLNSGALVPVPGVGFGAYRVPAYRPREGDKVVPFNRRRRLLAHHMAYSKITAPHVVTVAEVDLHRTSQLRETHKERYKKEGVPLTMLAFVCNATVRALREHPTMNARVLDDAYVVLGDINLGIAVDASEGLIVPNIKRADELSLRGLAKAIDEVAQKARASKITADDLANSSFSVSNPGLKGNLFGGAIIAQPNVGILRMGKIQKRPVVVDANGEDVIAIHPVMYLALSYDHRIIDGVLGNSFLYRIAEILEKADFAV